ncbi:MAG: hypothetical protein R6X06_02535 [Gammaproteobacteria bacterium]
MTMTTSFVLVLILTTGVGGIATSYAAGPEPTGTALQRETTTGFSSSIGLQFDSGDYASANTTDTWRIPFDISYTQGNQFYGLHSAYVSARSNGAIIISSSTHARMFTASNRNADTVSGLADINLYAGHIFAATPSTRYSLTAQIKLPTADADKGLGTGEADVSLEAGILRRRTGGETIFASLGYQFSGDSATTDYANILFASAGFSTAAQQGRRLGVILDYAQATTAEFDSGLELRGFMGVDLATQRHLNFYALLGLSDGSPDYGAGMNYRYDY